MPKICEEENCRIAASYGEYYGKPIRCVKHKNDGLKVVHILCREADCKIRASYNIEGNKNRLYCAHHKKE